MIAAVATMLNEADICERSVGHLLASGVGRVYVALATDSTDGTRDVLASFGSGVSIVPDRETFHDQPRRTAELANQATADGAQWIVPFDADEFPYPCEHTDFPGIFAMVPQEVNKVIISRWQHTDWDHRYVDPEWLPKVAWRAGIEFDPHAGNHDVTIEGAVRYDVLHMRELQFRSFEHMVAKSRERVARIDPAFNRSYGVHQRRLAELDGEALEQAWADLMAVPTVFDPIPAKEWP